MKKKLGIKSIFAASLFVIISIFCSSLVFAAEVGQSLLALYNCTIIDGTGGKVITDGIILVNGDKIENVGTSKKLPIPDGYTKIDLRGATVLPGFINTHVHVKSLNEVQMQNEEEKLQKWLMAGVTTVRDLAARDPLNFTKRRDELNANPLNARLLTATPIITAKDGYGGFYVDSVEDAKNDVNKFIDRGADIIKIAIEDDSQNQTWPMLSADIVKSIVATAHARNKKVTAHISHVNNLEIGIEAGVDEFAHMVVEPMDKKIINKIVSKKIYWIPTLELWHGVSGLYPIDYESVAIENLGKFYKAGGRIALGTDFGGFITDFDDGFPITEVQLMKKAGMTNMDIIIAGTRNAAQVCDLGNILGTLEAGKIADLLIINGNPLDKLEALQNTQMVIHNGKIVFQK